MDRLLSATYTGLQNRAYQLPFILVTEDICKTTVSFNSQLHSIQPSDYHKILADACNHSEEMRLMLGDLALKLIQGSDNLLALIANHRIKVSELITWVNVISNTGFLRQARWLYYNYPDSTAEKLGANL